MSDISADDIRALKPSKINTQALKKMISLIDLTSLNQSDTASSIALFCKKADTSFGAVAAVCVYPQFVKQVATEFADTRIKTATVVNFPQGTAALEVVLAEIHLALTNGAQEIDVVFPYRSYLAGSTEHALQFVNACKMACANQALLKVILETGELQDLAKIAEASQIALIGGADFIKTSTGKVPLGASLEAVATILSVIRNLSPHLKQSAGIKISGGVRAIEQAMQYIQLTEMMMGASWVSADTFRIGASSLVDAIIDYHFD
ncbi:MAG: deoxyribose-phosphate aldolase [Gammaproteobacteria bacterium]|nr:deoxyribose-phosphate aldolase [Gammaproteobacteria bacterium]